MKCVFCGNSIPVRYDEFTPYYECECEDSKRERKILEEMRLLDKSRPVPKFKYATVTMLVPIAED